MVDRTMTTLERNRRTSILAGVGVFLIVAGRYSYSGITVSGVEFGWVTAVRWLLAAVAILIVLSIIGVFVGAVKSATGGGRPGNSIGGGIIFSSVMWIASDQATLDWRVIRRLGLVVVALVVVAIVPPWVWERAPIIGGYLLGGLVLGRFWTDLFGDSPRWGRWVKPAKVAPLEIDDEWGRDTRKIKRDWPRLVQDLMSKTEGPVKTKLKAPKLINVSVSSLTIKLTIEPPPMWTPEGLQQLATGLKNTWSGVKSDVRPVEGRRMQRRRVDIVISMQKPPLSVPYPTRTELAMLEEGAVPLGVDPQGRMITIKIGPRAVPHVLVAGQSGSGKSSAMRVIALGMVDIGADVHLIDPKREGDLDGISPHPTMLRAEEWANHFQWLLREQERRAEMKRRGEPLPPAIVTIIDELTQIATGMGATDAAELRALQVAHGAFMKCVLIGRGTGIHIISGIQQASAEGMGGKFATAIRDQHLGRVLLGRASSPENRKMMLGDRNLTPEDFQEMMDAPPGRAWVSGTSSSENLLIDCIQVYDVPERPAGVTLGQLHLEPETASTAVADPPPPPGDRPSLKYLIACHLYVRREAPRKDLERLTDPPVATTTLKRLLNDMKRDGIVDFDTGPAVGNRPVVVRMGEWPSEFGDPPTADG